MDALALLEDYANARIRREWVFRDHWDFLAHDDDWLISRFWFLDMCWTGPRNRQTNVIELHYPSTDEQVLITLRSLAAIFLAPESDWTAISLPFDYFTFTRNVTPAFNHQWLTNTHIYRLHTHAHTHTWTLNFFDKYSDDSQKHLRYFATKCKTTSLYNHLGHHKNENNEWKRTVTFDYYLSEPKIQRWPPLETTQQGIYIY